MSEVLDYNRGVRTAVYHWEDIDNLSEIMKEILRPFLEPLEDDNEKSNI